MSSLCQKIRFLNILFFVFASSMVWASQSTDSASEVVKEFHIKLMPDFVGQKLLIFKEDGVVGKSLSIVADKDGKQSVISKASFALPDIRNKYSPASYDGFAVAVLSGQEKIVSVSGGQGEDLLYKYASSRAGDIINLTTREDGNTESVFNVQFQYDASVKKIVVSKVLLLSSNSECDKSILSVYALPSNDLMSIPFEEFDGAKAFEYLKKLRSDFMAKKIGSEKLFSVSVTSNFEKALAAFKVGDKAKLKELMGNMLVDGGSSDSCPPDSYVVEKYYYPGMVGWSNDVGFLFAEAGYYQEAIELLKVVVSENQDRTVAYLNLADAYWGLGLKELSAENYKKYSLLMQQSGKFAKIPKRVGERI